MNRNTHHPCKIVEARWEIVVREKRERAHEVAKYGSYHQKVRYRLARNRAERARA